MAASSSVSTERALLCQLLMLMSDYYSRRIGDALKRGIMVESSSVVSAMNYTLAAVPTNTSREISLQLGNTLASMHDVAKRIEDHSHFLKTAVPGIAAAVTAASTTSPTFAATSTKTVVESPVTMEDAVHLCKQTRILLQTNQTDTNVPMLVTRALSTFTSRGVILTNRAVSHLKMHHPLQAVQYTHTALILDPTQVKARYRQADAFYQLKEYDAAKPACQRGMRMTKDQSMVTAFMQHAHRITATTSLAPHRNFILCHTDTRRFPFLLLTSSFL